MGLLLIPASSLDKKENNKRKNLLRGSNPDSGFKHKPERHYLFDQKKGTTCAAYSKFGVGTAAYDFSHPYYNNFIN